MGVHGCTCTYVITTLKYSVCAYNMYVCFCIILCARNEAKAPLNPFEWVNDFLRVVVTLNSNNNTEEANKGINNGDENGWKGYASEVLKSLKTLEQICCCYCIVEISIHIRMYICVIMYIYEAVLQVAELKKLLQQLIWKYMYVCVCL